MKREGRYINLDRSPERRLSMEQELAVAGLDWIKRFVATDGAPQRHLYPGNGACVKACLQSHMGAIASCAADSFAFIFEDDIRFSLDFDQVLSPGQMAMLEPFDMVFIDFQLKSLRDCQQAAWQALKNQLVHAPERFDLAAPRRVKGVSLYRLQDVYLWGASAYVVTPRGRARLLALLQQYHADPTPHAVDMAYSWLAQNGHIHAAALLPLLAIVRPQVARESTIGTDGAPGVPELDFGSEDFCLELRELFFAGPVQPDNAVHARYLQQLRQSDAF